MHSTVENKWHCLLLSFETLKITPYFQLPWYGIKKVFVNLKFHFYSACWTTILPLWYTTFWWQYCTCSMIIISAPLILIRSVQGQSRREMKWPGAGWLGTWWRPMLCYGAYAARQACLCAVSQHFSPGEQTVYCFGCGGMFGWGRWWANHRKWKWEGKSDGASARCFCNASRDEMP